MDSIDKVIAHLLMMRGSEEKFWANANQHPLHIQLRDCSLKRKGRSAELKKEAFPTRVRLV